MPKKSVREMSDMERLHHSLGARTFHAVLILAAILGIAAVSFGYYLYSSSVMRDYRVATWRTSRTAMHALDIDEVRALAEPVVRTYEAVSEDDRKDPHDPVYLSRFETVYGSQFDHVCSVIGGIQQSNGAIAAYIAALDTENNRMIFIADADPGETFCPPGQWDALSDEMMDAFINGSRGGKLELFYGTDPIPSVVSTMEQYGRRCTAGTEMFEVDGYPVYIFYDTDMREVTSISRRFLLINVALLAVVAFLVAFFMMRHLKKSVVEPIDELADAAAAYIRDRNDEHRTGGHFDKLEIHTGDEIENLCLTMKDMEKDLADYIQNLTAVTAEKERIGTELGIASALQVGMLPNIFPPYPERQEFEIFASMHPAKEVGGDFYDFFLIDEDHLAIVMADVSGKGVPAALFMMASKIMFKNYATMVSSSPATVLEQVNHQICLNNSENMFVTVWLGILEISTGKIRAANAGHEYPALMRSGENFELFKDRHGLVIGAMDGARYEEYEIELSPGDALFLYTDGVTEASGVDTELFGTDRMLDALNTDPGAVPAGLMTQVKVAIDEFTGDAEQFDDITMLAMRYNGNVDKKLTIKATVDNLNKVIAFIDGELEAAGCGVRDQMKIDIAVEELFTNIAKYAYAPRTGNAVIGIRILEDPRAAEITFADAGMPYDPFSMEDPDITLSAEDRDIGGLGVFMVKKSMDETTYEYRNGHNIVKIVKLI